MREPPNPPSQTIDHFSIETYIVTWGALGHFRTTPTVHWLYTLWQAPDLKPPISMFDLSQCRSGS